MTVLFVVGITLIFMIVPVCVICAIVSVILIFIVIQLRFAMSIRRYFA